MMSCVINILKSHQADQKLVLNQFHSLHSQIFLSPSRCHQLLILLVCCQQLLCSEHQHHYQTVLSKMTLKEQINLTLNSSPLVHFHSHYQETMVRLVGRLNSAPKLRCFSYAISGLLQLIKSTNTMKMTYFSPSLSSS